MDLSFCFYTKNRKCPWRRKAGNPPLFSASTTRHFRHWLIRRHFRRRFDVIFGAGFWHLISGKIDHFRQNRLDVVADERSAADSFADVEPEGDLGADQDFHGRLFRRVRQETTGGEGGSNVSESFG